MDHIDEHYENVEKSSSELRWFFEEYGYEIDLDNKIDVASKTMRYTIACGNHMFKCSTTLMKDYSALDKIWECYKKVSYFVEDLSLDSAHYEWIDSDKLESLMKHLHR